MTVCTFSLIFSINFGERSLSKIFDEAPPNVTPTFALYTLKSCGIVQIQNLILVVCHISECSGVERDQICLKSCCLLFLLRGGAIGWKGLGQ